MCVRLPGCPSPTDSEVNKKQSSSMRALWKPFNCPFIVDNGCCCYVKLEYEDISSASRASSIGLSSFLGVLILKREPHGAELHYLRIKSDALTSSGGGPYHRANHRACSIQCTVAYCNSEMHCRMAVIQRPCAIKISEVECSEVKVPESKNTLLQPKVLHSKSYLVIASTYLKYQK